MLIGIFAGTLSGLLGIGGGFLLVPLQFFALTYIGVDPSLAIRISLGTSLAIIIPTALTGAYKHHCELKNIFKIGVILGIFGLIGGIFGGIVASYIPSSILEVILGLFLIIIAIYTIFNQIFGKEKFKDSEFEDKNSKTKIFKIKDFKTKSFKKIANSSRYLPLIGGILALIIGFTSGILGIGGGIFLIPVLIYLLNYSMKEAIGISSVFIALTAIGGTLSYIVMGWSINSFPLSLGYVNLINFIGIAVFSIPMAYIGAKLTHNLSDKILQYILAILLFYMGIRMLGLDPLSYLLGI